VMQRNDRIDFFIFCLISKVVTSSGEMSYRHFFVTKDGGIVELVAYETN